MLTSMVVLTTNPNPPVGLTLEAAMPVPVSTLHVCVPAPTSFFVSSY